VSDAPDVSIVVVSYGSDADLAVSLPAAAGQRGAAVEIVVVENGDAERSRPIAAESGARFLPQKENGGFAGGANAGIAATSGRYVLTLNPDCRLAPDFCAVLAARLDRPDAADAGSASGKIYRAEGPDLAPTGTLDSTGIVFTASGRHFDRSSGETAEGRDLEPGEVAGTSGAAGFYRRAALADARISTGYFDADFFLYREDADLALRLSSLGWRCLYVPSAVAWHRRRNLPERRRSMSALANMHSVKNRFLLRINNRMPGGVARTFMPTFLRDLVVVGACLTVEHSSLPAFGWLWRNRKRLWEKRREIRDRARLAQEHRGGA